MLRIAAELGLPITATNDAHYLKREDAEAHDVLLAIGTGKDLDDPKRFRFFGQESYLKSESEMRKLFGEHPDTLAETARVADLCEFDFEKRYFLPQYPRPAEFATDQDLLVHLARLGAVERYGDPLPAAALQRLEYELERYGRESVGQIITFGTLKARAAFRDVARTLRVEMGDVERLTKLIPSGPAFSVTLAEAPEKVPEVKAAAAQDERIRKVLDLGARIEGLARHASVHAAGVVIAPGPLDAGMHLVFINRKLGREKVRYPQPALEEILAPTYGVIVYQEQVMRIASALAGYSLAEADVLRKAVGKKIKELIQEELDNFV